MPVKTTVRIIAVTLLIEMSLALYKGLQTVYIYQLYYKSGAGSARHSFLIPNS